MKERVETNPTLGNLLMQSSIDAIIAIDNNNRVIAWNKAAANYYNKNESEALECSLPKLIPSMEADEELIKCLELAKNGVGSFLRPSARHFHRTHAEMHIIPLKQDWSLTGILLLTRDVSHSIFKEEELKYLNKELQSRLRQLKITTRELSYLTHIATHNIKDPLRNFYTTIERMIETEARVMSNSGRAAFRRIQATLTRMSLLIDDIITLTHINIVETPDTLINLGELVAETISLMQPKIRGSRIEITTDNLCEVKAHKNQLLLLLQQVISNAIRFNDSENPFIHISCGRKMIEPAASTEERSGEFYELLIMHNGNGFENTDSYSIFQSLDKSGEQSYMDSGIATAIAAKVMEAHKGFLVIAKDKDENTNVRCYFPV